MKRLLFLSIFMLLAVALFAKPYSNNSPSPTDNTAMDVTFKVGDSAANKIIVAFTDTPCTSFDSDELKANAKKKIMMVLSGSSGKDAITDKQYYISYIIVTEQSVNLRLTASRDIINTENNREFSFVITTESGKTLTSDKGDKYIDIPVNQSNGSYGVYGSEGFTIKSDSHVSSDVDGANYSGWLSVEVTTVS